MMEAWLSQPKLSPKMNRELSSIVNRLVENSGDKEAKEELIDRFYKDLDFELLDCVVLLALVPTV